MRWNGYGNIYMEGFIGVPVGIEEKIAHLFEIAYNGRQL
jgi:hypothetical protein